MDEDFEASEEEDDEATLDDEEAAETEDHDKEITELQAESEYWKIPKQM